MTDIDLPLVRIEQSPIGDLSLEASSHDPVPPCIEPAQPETLDSRRSFAVLGAVIIVSLATLSVPISSGVYYSALIDDFEASREETAWLYASVNTMLSISGLVAPVAVALVGRRRLVVLAAVLASAGMVASAFAWHLWQVVVWYVAARRYGTTSKIIYIIHGGCP